MTIPNLVPFLAESLLLDGLPRAPLNAEIEAMEKFLALPAIGVLDLDELARVFMARPAAGKTMASKLKRFVNDINDSTASSWKSHVRFMRLMPYDFRNGMMGRALWAWSNRKKGGDLPRSFLHAFYQQTLNGASI